MHVPCAKRVVGFTLIELMVTLTILAILAMVAAPSFADFLDRYRLRGAVDDVVSTISNARAEAVKADRDVNVSLKGTSSGWCVGANAAADPAAGTEALGATECDCTDSSPACVVGGQTLVVETGKHRGVSVAAADINDSFSFDSKLGVISPLGTASATFTSPSSKYDVRVDVNALGQTFVCTPGTREMAGVPSC